MLRQHFAELCRDSIPWAAGKGWLWPRAQQQFHTERWTGEKIKFAHDQIKKGRIIPIKDEILIHVSVGIEFPVLCPSAGFV